jgi:Papain family cysteine protease
MRDFRAACQPICDQGRLLACVAFAGTASHELLRADGVKLSEAFLHWACKSRDGLQPSAGTTLQTLDEALTIAGQARDDLWPYDPAEEPGTPGYGPSPTVTADAATRLLAPGRVVAPTPAALKSVLDGNVAPVLGLRVFRAFFEARPGILIDLPPGNPRSLGSHAVTVVGYDDSADLEFLIRNSWGTDWGTNGYGRLSRRYLEVHGLLAWLPGTVAA